MTTSKRAIIKITIKSKVYTPINYSRRMYAIIKRYTPDTIEGERNECFAELTGLRTFFKMTYVEIAESILKDLRKEIGIIFTVQVSNVHEYEVVKSLSKKAKTISTYKEINKLFIGKSFVSLPERKIMKNNVSIKKIRLTIPFLGKVR